MKSTLLFIGVLLCLYTTIALCDVSGLSAHFTQDQKAAWIKTLSAAQLPNGSFGSTKETHFAVASLKSLGNKIPNQGAVCTFLKSEFNSYDKVEHLEDVYHAVSAMNTLKCGVKATKAIAENLRYAMDESSSVDSLFWASQAGLLLANSDLIDDFEVDFATAVSTISELRDEEGVFLNSMEAETASLFTTGLAYKALSLIASSVQLDDEAQTSIEVILDGIEDVIPLGEEGNDRRSIAFYDNGDSRTAVRVTGTLISGIAALLEQGSVQVEEQFSTMVGEFFVSQVKQSTVEGIYYLLEGVNALGGDNLKNPIALVLKERAISFSSKSPVSVSVTDIWGKSVSDVSVFLVKAVAVKDESVVLTNQELKKVKSVYQFNMLTAKPEPGFYSLEFGATATDSKFASITSSVQELKLISGISVSDVSLQIVDSVDEEVVQKQTVGNGKTLEAGMETDYYHNIMFSFSVKSSSSGRPILVQQAFARFESDDVEVILPATFDNKNYKLTVNLASSGELFQYHSGSYKIFLLVGDAFVSNPLQWDLGELKITFPVNMEEKKSHVKVFVHREDIEHTFRVPEKRPKETVALAFTGLTLAPLLFLVVGILSVGFNLSNMSLSGLITLGCIGAGAGLYVLYWLHLNMFQTLGCLTVISIPGIFFGTFALRHRQKSNSKSKTE